MVIEDGGKANGYILYKNKNADFGSFRQLRQPMSYNDIKKS